MKCEICGKEFQNLGMHTKYSHNLSGKEYYDKYLRKEGEGYCEVCGKLTEFTGITTGYRNCCSIQCVGKSKLRLEKTKTTNLEKYGVENTFSIPKVKEKAQKNSHTKDASIKQWETRRKKYKIDPLHTEETKQKAKLGINKTKQQSVEKFLQSLLKFEQENNCTGINKLIKQYGQGWLKIKDQLHIINKGQYSFVKNEDIKKIEEYFNTNHWCNSNVENEIFNYIQSIYNNTVFHRTRKILQHGELDIYIPDKKIAIEVDGIYWHSYNFNSINKSRQLDKTKECEQLNIRLIHITDYEWNNHQEICKSIICSALGIYKQKIYARDCIINMVNSKEAKDFLIKNHIQGNINASYKLGLFYNNELVQIMCIGKSRFKQNEYELLRMCTKLNTQIIGGFSKLLKYQPYNELISYIDRSKFNGKSYYANNFIFLNYTKPSYTYYKNNIKLNRVSAQKHKLKKLLGSNFNENETEIKNMIRNGWLQVYDCGNIKVRWTNENN